MDERHDKAPEQLTTADLAAAAEHRGKGPNAGGEKGATAAGPVTLVEEQEPSAAPLFGADEGRRFRERWDEVQKGFVDAPRRAVEQADGLVAEVMQCLAQIFAEERKSLEAQWERGHDISTEGLRQTLRRYRSFFDRLLSIRKGGGSEPVSSDGGEASEPARHASAQPSRTGRERRETMATRSDDTISILNTLIETCKDGEAGFRTAAEGVRNPQLKPLFMDAARERSQFAAELQAEVRRLGGDPEKAGSASGAVHRGWMNIKSAVTGGSESAILSEAESGEDSAVKAYQEALGASLGPESSAIVQREYSSVKAMHDRIRALRDQAKRAA